MAIYFVTETYLEKSTPITANVDATDVTPWVQVNAENWVRKIIGTYFFNDLLTKYNNQSLSADEVILVELMKPAIAWRAASDAVFGLSYQLKNKGLQQQNGDYSTEVDLTEVQFAMKHYADKAGIYEAAIYTYLEDKTNADLYPMFTNVLNVDSDIRKCGGTGPSYNQSIMVI
jgi:hypothetical protein